MKSAMWDATTMFPAGLSGMAARRGASPADAPLAGLAGSVLSERFRNWHGASGRRYLFSILPLAGSGEDGPRFEDAVVLAVRRGAQGERAILLVDETGPLPGLFYASAHFRDALGRGANEIHVHLLTEAPAARAAAVRDLRPLSGDIDERMKG